MVAPLLALLTVAPPAVIGCVEPCKCASSVRFADARLAETTNDDRHLNIGFDDHPIAVAIELGVATVPGAARLEVTTWEGVPVTTKPRAGSWQALEHHAWLKVIHVPLRAGSYRIIAHVAQPCGDLAIRLHSIDVFPADPTSLAFWELRAASASQDGSLEDQLRAWKQLERMDAIDHGIDMAQAMTWAGKPEEAERLVAEFRTRNPGIDVSYVRRNFPTGPLGAVHGTRFYPGRDPPPCSDDDIYDVQAYLVGVYPAPQAMGPDGGRLPIERPWPRGEPPVAADRVEITVRYASQAKKPEHPAVRVVFEGDGGTVTPHGTWFEQPGAATASMHFPSAPATYLNSPQLFPVEPGSYRARVEIAFGCGVVREQVVFRAVQPNPDDPDYWISRAQVAIDAREFKEALEDVEAYERLGGSPRTSERVGALIGLGRKAEADELINAARPKRPR